MSTSDDFVLCSKNPIEDVFSINFDSICYFCKKSIPIGRVELGTNKEGKKEVRVYKVSKIHNCNFTSEKEDRDN